MDLPPKLDAPKIDAPERTPAGGFYPSDPLDGRVLGEWRSRHYDEVAKKQYWGEATAVLVMVVVAMGGLVATLSLWPNEQLGADGGAGGLLVTMALAWLAGMLGGATLAMKWLYHSVAKGIWHVDRRPWRLLSPIASGPISVLLVLLVGSGLIGVFDARAIAQPRTVIALGILVGLFSDSALAKLSEVAGTIFGVTEAHHPKPSKPAMPNPGEKTP